MDCRCVDWSRSVGRTAIREQHTQALRRVKEKESCLITVGSYWSTTVRSDGAFAIPSFGEESGLCNEDEVPGRLTF